jgi:hypothetical protein
MIDRRRFLTLWFALQAASLCQAQPAPGEDPLVLNQGVHRTMVPLPTSTPAAPSAYRELPAWMDAKLARFQAKAFATDTTGVVTDEDVVTRTAQEGVRKVCTQELASNSTGSAGGILNRYGPRPDAQIVVLRGDLVNICR